MKDRSYSCTQQQKEPARTRSNSNKKRSQTNNKKNQSLAYEDELSSLSPVRKDQRQYHIVEAFVKNGSISYVGECDGKRKNFSRTEVLGSMARFEETLNFYRLELMNQHRPQQPPKKRKHLIVLLSHPHSYLFNIIKFELADRFEITSVWSLGSIQSSSKHKLELKFCNNISQVYSYLFLLQDRSQFVEQSIAHSSLPYVRCKYFIQLAYFRSVQLVHLDDWSCLFVFINKLMKASKNPFSTIYHASNKQGRNQKIVKASDIKLNDVLINGVQLHCFKVIKNKRIFLPRKHHLQERQYVQDGNRDSSFLEEDNLFKNNAIKRRLRSLENDQNPLLRTSYEPFSPKRVSLHVNNFNKVPIQILRPFSKQKPQESLNNPALPQSFKFIDVNQKYYSLLKKQLAMSTNKHFNSTIVKNKIPFGKYVGLRAEKLKKSLTDRDSNLITKTIVKIEKYQDRNRYENISGKESVRLGSEDSKRSFQYNYQNVESDHHQQIDEESRQKLKICYSTKHKFKRWKETIIENTSTLEPDESKQSQANSGYKSILSPTLE